MEQGRYEEARQIYESILPLVPPRFALIHLKLGNVYDHFGQSEQARAEYEKYLDLAPPTDEDRVTVMRRLLRLQSGG